MSRWTSKSVSKQRPLVFDESLRDEEGVILLSGRNAYNMDLYVYLRITLGNLQEMQRKMLNGEDFIPSYYGTVVQAGTGQPTEEIKAEMKALYGVVDFPKPKPTPPAGGTHQPKLWDEDF